MYKCTKVFKQISGSTINTNKINTADHVHPTTELLFPLPTTLRQIPFHNRQGKQTI